MAVAMLDAATIRRNCNRVFRHQAAATLGEIWEAAPLYMSSLAARRRSFFAAMATTKMKPTFKIGDPVILRGRIAIPDQDKLTGEKTVVVKMHGFGTPRVTTAYVEKAVGRATHD